VRRPGWGQDRGVTLVELMVSITILGIIVVPLTEAFIVGLRTTAEASTSLANSHDTQLVDYYLRRDSSGATAQVGLTTAGACSGAAVASPVLELSWQQAPVYTSTTLTSGLPQFGTGASYVADYVASGPKLYRYYCVGGGAAQVTTVAYNLSTTTAPVVTSTSCGSASSPGCVSVTLTDNTGRQYTTVLFDRSY